MKLPNGMLQASLFRDPVVGDFVMIQNHTYRVGKLDAIEGGVYRGRFITGQSKEPTFEVNARDIVALDLYPF